MKFPDHLKIEKLPLPEADFVQLEMRVASKQEYVDSLVILLSNPANIVMVPLSANADSIKIPHVQGATELVNYMQMIGRLADAVIDHWWHARYAAEHRKKLQGT
jgi:hypothetical protein